MRPTHTSERTSVRHRKIGRRVIRADHLNRALETKNKKTMLSWLRHVPSIRPRTIALTGMAILVVTAATFGGLQIYLGQVAASEKAATAERQDELEAKRVAADACRRQKLEEKADQIGTITYDELYNHGECDK